MSEWVPNTEVNSEDYYYEPLNFVKSHCKPNDPYNNSTQIWDVVFEPGNSDVIATCGGRFLCVFRVSTGELILKYTHKEVKHEFFTLSWTRIEDHMYLASGSSTGELRLYHPANQVSFHHWSLGSDVAVYAVEFLPKVTNWIFVATNDSEVGLWDIGVPKPPYYSGCNPCQIMRVIADKGDIYSLAWIQKSKWLFIGTEEGLVGWHVELPKVKEIMFPRYRPEKVEFRLPGEDEDPYVDSVCALGEDLVAAKCVGYGRIFVFRAQFNRRYEKDNLCDVEVLLECKWSGTDDFYMNLGSCQKMGLLACGDNVGTTWVYVLPPWIYSADDSRGKKPMKMLPIGRLPWPDINGNPSKQITMLDKVTFSPCGNYMVSVTNTNIVAMWKRHRM